MQVPREAQKVANPTHSWLKLIEVSFKPGAAPMSAMLEEFVDGLLNKFQDLGHKVVEKPTDDTDVLLTTAQFEESIPWRKALLFTARHKFGLKQSPVIYTVVQMTPKQFDDAITHLRTALAKKPIDPKDFLFEGLSPDSPRVLIEQGLRGGPIMALMRLLQARAKSIRILLAVGDEHPDRVYHFDLVGAFPESDNIDANGFYTDVVLRMVTTESTHEITNHQVMEPVVTHETWEAMSTPEAMGRAGKELGKRNFFTDMVRIEELVAVPAVSDVVASQYSEGCFGTWDPRVKGLVATITGSARPVDKGNITDDDLALIVGVRPDGQGAQVRHVEGKRNDKPSSEAVEMMDLDGPLPWIDHESTGGVKTKVPVARSKLHGHRGVKAYNPKLVEYVPLDPPYYHYLVSCATEAQARGIRQAFSRAESLLNPNDPRKIAFTVLPGHGVVMVEKLQANKVPFQQFWEAMDSGELQIDPHVPQGQMSYEAESDGRMHLREQGPTQP